RLVGIAATFSDLTCPRGMRALLVLVSCVAAAAWAQAPMCANPLPVNDGGTPSDAISYTRILRRLSLSLTRTTPTPPQYEAMSSAASDADREAQLSSFIEAALGSTKFYERVFHFGQGWLAIGAYSTGAVLDGYEGDMSGHLLPCAGNTLHAGK